MPALHAPGCDRRRFLTESFCGIGALALAGVATGLFFYQFGKNSMVPKNDPLVIESLNKH
jgi:hypothetical protein